MVKNLPANAGDVRCGFDPQVGKFCWNGKWTPAPVFLPGKSHGPRSLAGHSPRGHRESDMTERLSTHTHTPEDVGRGRKKRKTLNVNSQN